MSKRALRDMMVKFEQTGQLGFCQEEEIKGSAIAIVENIVIADVEASTELSRSSVSGSIISHFLYSTA